MELTGSDAVPGARGCDGAGIIVVDQARRILFKNRLAESVLASSSSLLEHQQTLASRMPSIDRQLRAAVLHAGRGQGASAEPQL